MGEIFLVLACALLGGVLGGASSRMPGRLWLAGYMVPLGVIGMFSAAARRPEWGLHPAVSWIWAGGWRMPVSATVVAMVFGSLIPRLPQARERRALALLVVVAVVQMSIWPAISFARSRSLLASLETRIPPDGVCRQSTDFTCGPAAAVTALHRLGIQAGEGELAIAARTSSASGTLADVLAAVLNERYGDRGVRAELRRFRTLRELGEAGPTLVVVKFGFLVDHWVLVLAVSDREVSVADPATGIVRMDHATFLERWRRIGVTVTRGKE